jgi:hypothetical protein
MGFFSKIFSKVSEKKSRKKNLIQHKTMSCSICTEKFQRGSRAVCPNNTCDLLVCKDCVRQFLLSNQNDACCLKCRVQFNRSSLVDMCGSTWVNTVYARHRENILSERITARIPEYDDRVACCQHFRQWKDTHYDDIVDCLYRVYSDTRMCQREIDGAIHRIGDQYKQYNSDPQFTLPRSFLDLPEDIYDDQKELILSIKKLQVKILESRKKSLEKLENLTKNLGPDASKEKKFITRGRCPNEDCIGFIGEGWKCMVCKLHICQTCMEPTSNTHVCNPDVVSTIELIRDSSKPCPNCRVRVTRSEGCSQMWCTNCKTAFDYVTGSIYKNLNRVHNPHYFEFLRNNGLERGQGPAGGDGQEPGANCISTSSLIRFIHGHARADSIEHEFRNALHTRDRIARNRDRDIDGIFFRYGMNIANKYETLEHLKKDIQKEEKAMNKMKEANAIRMTWAETVFDIIQQMMDKRIPIEDAYNLLRNNNDIAENELGKSARTFNSSKFSLIV